MPNERRLKAIFIALSFVPPALLVAAFLFVNGLWGFGMADYERYREFWGGNPSEVFSHWLDMIVMSGSGLSLGWFLTLEAFARQRMTNGKLTAWFNTMLLLCLFGSIAAGVALDKRYGEGTVLYAAVIGFLPVLASWCYLLRKTASFCGWGRRKVLLLSAFYVFLNTGAQLVYEPSGTGGPNGWFLSVWLGSMALAVIVALGVGLRSGRLLQFCSRTLGIVRKPVVWVPLIVVILGITVPLTIHAQRLRQPRQTFAMKWLDDIERVLSDEIVRELQHGATGIPEHQKMEIPDPARMVMGDSRVALGSSLRIYVRVTDRDYLFLWANSSFDYCDVRPLDPSERATVEIDQEFIDALRKHQATYETGLYSILWSPYLAGRVLKTRSGEVKAICVIKSQD